MLYCNLFVIFVILIFGLEKFQISIIFSPPFYHLLFTFPWASLSEPWRCKNQQNECAPSEDSDQPGHPPSLVRVFAVRMKKTWVLSYPLSAQRRLIRLGGCPGWSESLLGTQSLCWFCHVAAHLVHAFVINIMPLGSFDHATSLFCHGLCIKF